MKWIRKNNSGNNYLWQIATHSISSHYVPFCTLPNSSTMLLTDHQNPFNWNMPLANSIDEHKKKFFLRNYYNVFSYQYVFIQWIEQKYSRLSYFLRRCYSLSYLSEFIETWLQIENMKRIKKINVDQHSTSQHFIILFNLRDHTSTFRML